MIRKTILICAALLATVAQAQVSTPASGDIMLNVSRGDGTFQSRYVDTVKTGELGLIMYGQDPTPGSVTSPPTLRVQTRRLGTSIVCGALNGSTCDFVATSVTIGSSQINDASPTGRALMTASSGAVALSTIGGASTSDLTTGLSGKANASHTHVVNDITDATSGGKSLMLMATPAAGRTALALGTGATANTPASGNAAAAELVIGSDTRLTDARVPTTHTQPASTISDSTTAGRSILTATDFPAQRSLLSVLSASEANAAFYPLISNPSAYISRAGISVTGNGSYNNTTGVITINGYTPPARVKTQVTKVIGTCFQISATRDAQVSYNVQITASAAVIGGAQGTLFLETFTDSACTTGTVEEMRSTSGNTNALALALGNVLTQTLNVNGWVMAGQYAKLRTNNDTGTPTYTARPGWEVQQ